MCFRHQCVGAPPCDSGLEQTRQTPALDEAFMPVYSRRRISNTHESEGFFN